MRQASHYRLRDGFTGAARIGHALRDFRLAAELTQEELAERAGLSPRSISGLERGEGPFPRSSSVALLVRALGLEGADRAGFEALAVGLRPRRPASRTVSTGAHVHPVYTQARHNVPRALNSFVGRERDVEEVSQLVTTSPLVTLVGVGGVGKTRLACELACRQADVFADGVALVELGEVTDASVVPGAIAAALGIQASGARDMTAVLVDFLRHKHLLLVLDNCEHLLDACASLVRLLLRACPDLHVLATSRQSVGMTGEIVWLVHPLEVPPDEGQYSLESVSSSAAGRLFLERVRAVDASFACTESNAASIAQICTVLDGLPLALELAAARIRLLSVEQLADRLDRDAHMLRGPARGISPRHETIRAAVDWSHDLLDEEERMLFRRLSVFAGDWTLDMAETVCSGRGIARSRVLDLIAQLIDKSMLLATTQGVTVARYRLLGPIRQYAVERLDASGEAAEYRARYRSSDAQLRSRVAAMCA
jgi:predicted ATPase/transcriptional regulator with XRE-family HTH domain